MRDVKWQSRRGWFFLSVNGSIYRLHLSLGGFSVAWERKEARH